MGLLEYKELRRAAQDCIPCNPEVLRVDNPREIDHLRVIPHIKDLRSWYDFDDESCEFIKEYPAVMQADIVQIYPAGAEC